MNLHKNISSAPSYLSRIFLSLKFLIILNFLSVSSASADITGTVFRDFNGDGIQALSATRLDIGIGGIIVSAYDSANSLVATTTSYPFNCAGAGVPDASCTAFGAPALGGYVLTGLVPGPYRVEYTLPADGSLDSIFSGAAGTGAGAATTVFFGNDGDLIDLALNSPGQHCQDSPDTVVACFGRNQAAGSTTDSAVRFSYDSTGRDPSLQTTIALVDEGTYTMGSVWGAAYNNLNNTVYFSSAIRAYAEVGSGGLGAIHQVDLNAPLPNSAIWATVPNAGAITQNLTASFNGHRDPEAYQNVGKLGIGDIDISEDGTRLYVMSLNDNGVLYEYGTVGALEATVLNTYPVTDPGCDDPTDVRPWGVTTHQGNVFIGVVCSEEAAGGTAADLSAHVMQLTPAGTFSTIFSTPLDYTKEAPTNGCFGFEGWFPWDSDITNFSNPIHSCSSSGGLIQTTFPMPLLSDIEFDEDGSLILGFADRFSLQNPHFDQSPDPADGTQLFENNAGGDIIRACFSGAAYFLEGSPECPLINPTDAEYYTGDTFLRNGAPAHDEVALGGLAILFGTGEVASTVYDPLDDPAGNNLSNGTSGVRWLNNIDGTLNDAYELVEQAQSPFAKGINLGDIELLCEPAPIEVGNYIWNDIDGDGIQGASEPAFAGVTVELLADTTGDGIADTVIGTAITDATGQYLFSSNGNLTSTANFIYGINGNGPDGLPNTADDVPGLLPSLDVDGDGLLTGPNDINNIYAIRVPGFSTQAPLAGLSLATANAADPLNSANPGGDISNNTQLDIRDSDGILTGTDVVIPFSTGAAGQNNHSFDIGFLDPPIGRLGDLIFLDPNANGIVDPGEAGIPGVTVNLIFFGADGILGGGDDVFSTTTTDAAGNYIFENLPFGNYSVTVDTTTLPAGLSQTFDFDGTGDNSSVTTLTAAGPEDLDQDFGYNSSSGTASVPWNGFCDPQIFLSMTNICTNDVFVQADLFGSIGNFLGTSSVNIAPGQQVDLSVNDFPGFTTTDFGVINLTSTPGGCITGDVGLFAPFGEGQLFTTPIIEEETLGGTDNLFALSDDTLSNSCYAVYNTFQPSMDPIDAEFTTVHWLQLINLDEEEKAEFTVNRFDDAGVLISNEVAVVNPLGRADIAAGHEDDITNRFGIVEVVPDFVGADYITQLFRYGMDTTVEPGVKISSFSLSDTCSVGMTGRQYLTISKGADAVNYIELYNINREEQTVNLEFFSNTAGSIRTETITLGALASVHIEASEGLLPGETGVVAIETVEDLPLIAKSTSYVFRGDGKVQTAISTEGRGTLDAMAFSSFNTFRNQINWLRVFNVSDEATTVTVRAFNQLNDAELGTQTIQLEGNRGQDISLNDIFGIGIGQVGRVELESVASGTIVADIIRVQSNEDFTALEALEVFAFR